MSEKENIKFNNNFLDPEIFAEKYETKYKQQNPETFLETVSEEDREIYQDVEILSGRNLESGLLNKFNCLGKKNRGKKYNSTKRLMMNSFEKFCQEKLSCGELWELWGDIFKNARIDSKFANILLERSMGKVKDEIDIKSDGEITFKIDNSKIIDTEDD